MTENLQENSELLDPEVQELYELKRVVKSSHKHESDEDEKKDSPYKEMIEKQKGPITRGNKENPKISLTFDDGYGPENVRHILDTLKGSGIKATFFILGDCLRNTPSLWKEAVEDGHQICCHTFSHIYLSSGEYTDLGDKSRGIKAGPGGLNKTDLNKRSNDVKNLLGEEYLNKLKTESGNGFPRRVKSELLLKTEILMWEAQIKKTLGEEYLNKFKYEHPFFRFPGGCGATTTRNINVLKELGYLSIGWSDDFFRGTGKSRSHISTESVRTMGIPNGAIPLFHFKSEDYKYIDAYIENMKNKNKTAHEVSEIIK